MNPSMVLTGNAAGIGATYVDVANSLGTAVAVKVLLSAAYTLANPRPDGFPTEPGLTGTAFPQFPGMVIASGTVLSTFQAKGAARVAAGAGSYV